MQLGKLDEDWPRSLEGANNLRGPVSGVRVLATFRAFGFQGLGFGEASPPRTGRWRSPRAQIFACLGFALLLSSRTKPQASPIMSPQRKHSDSPEAGFETFQRGP